MTKNEFLAQLRKENKDPDLITYYDELISDLIEDGQDEATVMANLNQKKVTSHYLYNKDKEELEAKSKGKTMKAAWIVFLMLFSSPVLLPVGIVILVLLIIFVVVGIVLVVGALASVLSTFITSIELIMNSASVGLILVNLGVHFVSIALKTGLAYIFIKGAITKVLNKISIKFFGASKRRKAKKLAEKQGVVA